MDRLGKMVIQPWFDEAGPFRCGLACVAPAAKSNAKPNDRLKYGYIDSTGKQVIPAQFYTAEGFSGGFANVLTSDPVRPSWIENWGFIDRRGNIAVQPKYARTVAFSEGLAAVFTRDKRMEYIDSSGKTVCVACGEDGKPLIVDPGAQAWPGPRFSEGLALFRVGACAECMYPIGFAYVGGRWGYIDKTGKVAIRPQFEQAEPFSEGLAAVCVEIPVTKTNPGRAFAQGNYGFIDHSGNMVIPATFTYASSFHNGLARIGSIFDENVEMFGYIDKTGKYVWQATK
jgi:hypothetical protein